MSVENHENPTAKNVERREFIKRAAIGMGAVAMGVVALGCSSSSGSPASTNVPPTTQPFTFAVITDIHILDADLLGGSGTAYTTYIEGDPKMLNLSTDTFDVALSNIMTTKPSFVLIPGDLTKDGEYADHLVVASKLSLLTSAGIPVYVVPGNHDINNPVASNYLDPNGSATSVPNITPAQFKSIYSPYGYAAALYTDPNSLSYIAEPVPGLWLIAIDSCEYQNNPAPGAGQPVTAGQISQATLTWIQNNLAQAKSLGKVVIGMEHHLTMEHFTGQEVFFSDYILSNYTTAGPALAAAGLNLIFTGHFHANSVAQTTYSNGATLTDVSTGSTVIAPCPYRFVTASLPAKTFKVTTQTVQDIPEYPTPSAWTTYENGFLATNMQYVAGAMLAMPPLSLSSAEITAINAELAPLGLTLASLLAASIAAFYAGNPNLAGNPAAQAAIQALVGNSATAELGGALEAIWKPGATLDDNNLTITLA